MRNIVQFDAARCSGCWACTATCIDQNDLTVASRRDAWRWVAPAKDNPLSFAMGGCMHCGDAPCMAACPRGCFTRRESGLVALDPEGCVGCGRCAGACPHDAIRFREKKAMKCNGCFERVEAGLPPACQKICPTGALTFRIENTQSVSDNQKGGKHDESDP